MTSGYNTHSSTFIFNSSVPKILLESFPAALNLSSLALGCHWFLPWNIIDFFYFFYSPIDSVFCCIMPITSIYWLVKWSWLQIIKGTVLSTYLFVQGANMESRIPRCIFHTHVRSVEQEVLQVLDVAVSTSLTNKWKQLVSRSASFL